MERFSSKLKAQYFFVAFLVAAPIAAYLLRQNNLTMIELRDEVLAIDSETGDFEQVEPKLEELANYVFSHMNTNVGSVELPGVFGKDVERLRQAAEQSGGANASVYAEAQQRCEDPSILLTARAQCIQDYVTANADEGSGVVELEFPDKALYSYSFASPTWSPDFAGFAVLITVLSFAMFIVLLLTNVIWPAIGRSIDRDPLE